MKRGAIWIILSCLMVTSLVLVSCGTSTSTTTSTSILTPVTTPTSTSKTTPIVTTVPTQTAITTTATTGNWWDKLGVPQYGGIITLRMNRDIPVWDPDYLPLQTDVFEVYMEKLFSDNWTLDPSVFNYQINWRPPTFVVGNMASWEMPDSSTYVVHLRQGIRWQNIPPANGREFTADDVVFHYDRMFGWGDGYTKPTPLYAVSNWFQCASVTASDKYTVVFKWKTACPEFIMETEQGIGGEEDMECPDAVKLWGDVNDWHHAIGTGAFILTDFVSASSATMVKNPNYWAYDERYPKNQLPYVDGIKFLIIPDDATALAALRTGKIDVVDQASRTVAQSIQKTNPAILQIPVPATVAVCIAPRWDKAPFTDIRVRQAMQLAIDLPTIASTYYGGNTDPSPTSLTSPYEAGWGLPYNQWPADLQAQYAYNPNQAKQLLASAGYPNGFNTDLVVDTGSDLDLMQIVKSYFAAIGISMEIRTMDPASWTSFVRVGHKQDALASLGGNGPLGLTYEPMRQLNRFVTGYAANWSLVSDPTFDKFLPTALADTNLDDIKKIVAQANLWVAQQHVAVSLLQPIGYSLCQPWLKGYNGQSFSIGGELGSPQVGSFYLPRFWIDHDLKNSTGY